MTTTALPPVFMPQFFDANSVELVNGQLFTYAAGTTTPISVYTDQSGANTFTNPIILNSRGEPTYNGASNAIWLSPGVAYKFVLKDPLGNIIWSTDNISSGIAAGLAPINFVADTGTTNALAVTLSPVPVAYTAGIQALVLVANTNTGATTLNVNGLGAKNVTLNGLALTAGTLQANQVYLLVYDGTFFELVSTPGPGAWVTNAYLAVMAAGTVKANITNASGSPSDVLIPSLITAGLYAPDTGVAPNVYVAKPTAPPASLSAGYTIAVKIGNTNTGASTLNVNAIGATAIQYQGAALASGLLVAGQIAIFVYDGAAFELINPVIPAVVSGNYNVPGHVVIGSLIINWGTISLGASPSTVAVVFDKAFTTNPPLYVIADYIGPDQTHPGCTSITNVGMNIVANSAQTLTGSVSYLALGN